MYAQYEYEYSYVNDGYHSRDTALPLSFCRKP
jgi:hypothetical protein